MTSLPKFLPVLPSSRLSHGKACARNSELLVNAGHYCLDNRDVIGEVARILREHGTP
jgi:hypothetical protein